MTKAMKGSNANKEYEALLNRGGELTVADFFEASPALPPQTVYSRIRSLVQNGSLSRVGRGRYAVVRKPKYEVPVTDWMLEVNGYLINNCEGIDHCVSQKGKNLFVEVARKDITSMLLSLGQHYEKVVQIKDYKLFPAVLEGFIVVGPLVSEAPMAEVSGCPVPSIEKNLVDSLCPSEPANKTGSVDFQKMLEVYPVNMDRLRRYASRRGLADELETCLASLDPVRMELVTSIQKYFSSSSLVTKAWVFGSFARREETPESDIDLLVDFNPKAKVSLLDIIRQKLDLERITGRQIDLVENGYLKPFAVQSADRDKYLIYER